jgi:hypothetical protein
VDASPPVPGRSLGRFPVGRVASAVAGLSLLAAELNGQLHSVPSYSFSAWAPGGILAAEYGRDLQSSEALAQHLGVRVYYRAGRLGVGGAAGWRNAGAESDLQIGGTAAVRLFSPLGANGALSLEGGIGYLESGRGTEGTTYLTVPLGVSLGLGEVALGGRSIRPWIAARVQSSRVTFARALLNQRGVGAAAGVAVDLAGPLGLHLAADWMQREERRLEGAVLLGGARFTLGAGVHVKFRPGSLRR